MQEHHRSAGFTLVEVLLVLAVMLTLSVLAMPSLTAFTARDREAGAATTVTRGLTQLKNQARSRNRAYVVTFAAFSDRAPLGTMTVVEGRTNSCQRTVDDLAARPPIAALGQAFGQEVVAGATQTLNPDDIGLRDWREGAGDRTQDDLSLCLRPNGSTLMVDAGVVRPPNGAIQMRIQRFDGDPPNWEITATPRSIRVPFSGTPRLEVN